MTCHPAPNSLAFAFYILCLEILSTSSRTSSVWKLNADGGRIAGARVRAERERPFDDDPVFSIVAETVYHERTSWVKRAEEGYCSEGCEAPPRSPSANNWTNQLNTSSMTVEESIDEALDCGKPANFTYYDNLVGISNRNKHPNVAEPRLDVFLSKSKKTGRGVEFDMSTLERRLRKAKKERPTSPHLYNQLGNYWRARGDARRAIECFRRALAARPHDADALLDLARVLHALQYLDDAIYLARRSLDALAATAADSERGGGAWLRYFALGEIFRAYGRPRDAAAHLRRALELRPGFEPARLALREIEEPPPPDPLHTYTLIIIVCLILTVLLVVITSMDNSDLDGLESKPHRHFNKAMAMRSLRGFGIAQKTTRSKRSNS